MKKVRYDWTIVHSHNETGEANSDNAQSARPLMATAAIARSSTFTWLTNDKPVLPTLKTTSKHDKNIQA